MKYFVGIDIGSTTIKTCVLDKNKNLVYSSYKKHEAKQIDKLIEELKILKEKFKDNLVLTFTGSGSFDISKVLNANFLQEVNALTLAVEDVFNKEVSSVVELGGQDAKVLIFEDGSTFTSMNDKCAGGTGATIERIIRKLNLSLEDVKKINFFERKIYPVASKCGVFAESDINSLQKLGVPKEDLIASLFNAIVLQNLNILTRGRILKPKVLLLGGPHFLFKALRQAWIKNLYKVWREKGFVNSLEECFELVLCPENAYIYPALGCALYALENNFETTKFSIKELLNYKKEYFEKLKKETSQEGLISKKEYEEYKNLYPDLPKDEIYEKIYLDFKEKYSPKGKELKKLPETVEIFIGIDGGSTSSKLIAIDKNKNVVAKAYRISKGNPLEDIKYLFKDLKASLEKKGVKNIKVLGVATTGYAKEMLKEALCADLALVETVAHTKGALSFFEDIDVICDIGGQDIKIIFLKNKKVYDFKLNTQCSAGNGFYLQSTCERFGYKIEEYEKIAFKAEKAPKFNVGCAVFLEQDIVNFQRMGWEPKEILAGLAKVLPLNVWIYVVQEHNLEKFGKRFLLQGGTQRNLAAVKAQVDFIKSSVKDAEVFVHPFTGEAGALGAALEIREKYLKENFESSFIGIDEAINLKFEVETSPKTVCNYCPNRCLRTFITFERNNKKHLFIIAPCEKGQAESLKEFKDINKKLLEIEKENPNLAKEALKHLFKVPKIKNSKLKVAIPRVLNMYSLAPFFIGFFENLDIEIEFSPYTNEKLKEEYLVGGTIDPCFPSKIALAHTRYLLENSDAPIIFFPKIQYLPTFLENTLDSKACPTVTATPMHVYASLTLEEDVFKKKNKIFLDPLLDFKHKNVLENFLFETFQKFGYKKNQIREAISYGFLKQKEYMTTMQNLGKNVFKLLKEKNKIGVVLLCRSYHLDPGINHQIPDEIQKRGYPILTIESLPLDEAPTLSIQDVWQTSYSENSNRKVWAAKYVASKDFLAAVDLSSFKCGHDAPILRVVEEILHSSNTPYFAFHELDENKPTGSIKIRVETLDYFLKELQREKNKLYV